MSKRTLQGGSLLSLLLMALGGWGQTSHYSVPAASVQDRFATYHQVLNDAADNLLSAGMQPARTERQSWLNRAEQAPRVADAVLRPFAQQYWNGEQENVRRALGRVTQLRPMLEPILREQGVPVALAAVVLVESGGRPTALSPKGALGLWQFMPDTARRYGLVVSATRDERTDALKSTRAAARYLRDLYSQFGDWQLAFAAYNAGEQAVQRAVNRTGTRKFQNLVDARLVPAETRDYVPAVLTAVQLLGGALDVTRPTAAGRNRRVLFAGTELSN